MKFWIIGDKISSSGWGGKLYTLWMLGKFPSLSCSDIIQYTVLYLGKRLQFAGHPIIYALHCEWDCLSSVHLTNFQVQALQSPVLALSFANPPHTSTILWYANKILNYIYSYKIYVYSYKYHTINLYNISHYVLQVTD